MLVHPDGSYTKNGHEYVSATEFAKWQADRDKTDVLPRQVPTLARTLEAKGIPADQCWAAFDSLSEREQEHFWTEVREGRRLPLPPVRGRKVVHPKSDDPMRNVSPEVYIPALTGEHLPGNKKISCPFHSDTSPSFQVYSNGWYCFGCGRYGDIYTLAEAIFGIAARGTDFLKLKDKVAEALGVS